MASPAFPADGRDDPVLLSAVAAWVQAEAECERLRLYRDVIEQQLGADVAVAELLTEETTAEREEDRPAGPGTMKGRDLTRQRESLSRAIHRSEARARTLRLDVAKLVKARGERKGPNLALIMAEMADEERAAQAAD
jgi:hypothetical protein